jgi:hypothetical protein
MLKYNITTTLRLPEVPLSSYPIIWLASSPLKYINTETAWQYFLDKNKYGH